MRAGGLLIPPLLDADVEAEIADDFVEQTEVPRFGPRRAAELAGHVDRDETSTAFLEPQGGPRHEARFAHLTRGEDVAIFADKQKIEQFGVFGTLNIDVTSRIESAADLQASLNVHDRRRINSRG